MFPFELLVACGNFFFFFALHLFSIHHDFIGFLSKVSKRNLNRVNKGGKYSVINDSFRKDLNPSSHRTIKNT